MLAGMYLAAVMLSQQRSAAALGMLRRAGVMRGPRVEAEQADSSAGASSASSRRQPEGQTAGSASTAAGKTNGAGCLPDTARHPGPGGQGADGAGDQTGEPGGHPTDVAVPIGDSEEAFWVWLHGICRRPDFLLEPPASAALAAPHLRRVGTLLGRHPSVRPRVLAVFVAGLASVVSNVRGLQSSGL